MDQTALYDEDFHAWALYQAAMLRGLTSAGLALPNDLDLEHVAEEIEDLGNEQRFAVESNLVQTFAHLIKVVVLPDDQTVRHWLTEIVAFRDTAARRYRPSMRRAIDVADLWRAGCRRSAEELEIYGHAVPALPKEPPFGLDEILDRRTNTRALAACLAAVLAA
jgi:Domain of unknown function DUF29